MSQSSLLIRHFKIERYSTVFNPITGFFARIEDSGCHEPFWSSHGPELLDISITNWCDRGCPICYANSSPSGCHMTMQNYETIMQQAQKMYVLQVALGGGNPNQHPAFPEILRLTREKYGIVPNYTTNGRGLTTEVLNATARYCGTVAVSAYFPFDETREAINQLASWRIKTNVQFVLSASSIDTAIAWLKAPPQFLSNTNALIFLNYKPVGRGRNQNLLLRNRQKVEQLFELSGARTRSFKLGFDSCSATGIARFTNTSSACYDGCDAGRFSMFVSEDMKMYPCSFMAESGSGVAADDDNLLQTWQKHELFEQIRRKLRSHHCGKCMCAGACPGPCPIFEEVNLCPDCRQSASSENHA